MIEYLTRDDIRSLAGQILSEERATTVRRAAGRSPAGATFLSHSTRDAELLPGVIRLLETHGAKVYIDKKDEALPPYTSRETATVLRTRIGQCRKFILFATKVSQDSRWMPWELGISDGLKRASGTAILPGVDTALDYSWTEREYLGVYDRIVFGDLKGESRRVWMVWNRELNQATKLSEWLEG